MAKMPKKFSELLINIGTICRFILACHPTCCPCSCLVLSNRCKFIHLQNAIIRNVGHYGMALSYTKNHAHCRTVFRSPFTFYTCLSIISALHAKILQALGRGLSRRSRSSTSNTLARPLTFCSGTEVCMLVLSLKISSLKGSRNNAI